MEQKKAGPVGARQLSGRGKTTRWGSEHHRDTRRFRVTKTHHHSLNALGVLTHSVKRKPRIKENSSWDEPSAFLPALSIGPWSKFGLHKLGVLIHPMSGRR